MSENKFKVVVTRAPRLKLVLMKSLQGGTLCCGPITCETYYTEKEFFVRIEDIGLRKIPWKEAHEVFKKKMVHVFESYEDMCKWVANGRKIEDLQYDPKHEHVTICNLPAGVPVEVVSYSDGNGTNFSAWEGVVAMKATTATPAFIRFEDGARFEAKYYSSLLASNMMVWPVRFDLGDKIEFIPA